MVTMGGNGRKSTDRVDPVTAEAAKRVESDVRAWYRRGQQALGLSGERSKGVDQDMQALVAEVGTNPATLRRARQLARVYTEKQLDVLLKLRTPEGLPLGWSHVQELISIKSKAERVRTQKRAAKEGWTVRRLKAEVQRLEGGKRSEGGRKFALPEAPEERLGRLTELSQTWRHLLDDVVLSDHARLAERIAEARSGGCQDAIQASLREVLGALDKVQTQAGKARKRLRDLEGTADTARPDGQPQVPDRESNGAGPRKKG